MLDILTIADREDQEISIALNIICSKLSCDNAEFTVAIPKDYNPCNDIAMSIIEKNAKSIVRIQQPDCDIDGVSYRICNKWNALLSLDDRPFLFTDSDVLFLRKLQPEFLIRSAPAAVPEYGLHVYPWKQLFEAQSLIPPTIVISLLGPEVGPVWLNAGFISCPNARAFGETWKQAATYVNTLSDITAKMPYLDQIALPLAMALLSDQRTVDHSHILPDKYNQHFIYWRNDLEYVASGYVAHHHNRVTWIKRFIPGIFQWVQESYPVVNALLEELSRFDPYERERIDK